VRPETRRDEGVDERLGCDAVEGAFGEHHVQGSADP
jgi:hypothetical protein